MALNVPQFAFEGDYAEAADKAMAKYPHDRRQSAVLALLDLSQRRRGDHRVCRRCRGQLQYPFEIDRAAETTGFSLMVAGL